MSGDSTSQSPTRVRIGLDPALAPWAPEVRYTLDTLLEAAGYAREWVWAEAGAAFDLYYGPEPEGRGRGARVGIPWSGRAFDRVGQDEPTSFGEVGGLPRVAFEGEAPAAPERTDTRLRYPTDLVYASFWWLCGAREPGYARDRVDNLSLEGTFLRESGLAGRPWISLLAAEWRCHLEAAGLRALSPEWRGSALAITHDVDYPEIVRAVELLRRPGDAAAILGEREPFWRFDDWVEFSESLGTHSAFYFMARRGSLLRYAMGEPDAFYDIGAPRYRSLLRSLTERGCELGLHGSFRSSEEPERYAAEKHQLEEASGARVVGNRQHYWRLAPAAPHESLAHLADAGFHYDSSLAFECMPGFRRGTCHPFRPWHPGRREALDLVEIPPAWMDDHYDGRLAASGISDRNSHARTLLSDVARSGGVAVVDYHVRGMNERFFPRWGSWLREFLPAARPEGMVGRTPSQIAVAWRGHVQRLDAASRSEL